MMHCFPVPVWCQSTARDQTMHMGMQHQGLAPGMQRGDDAGLRPEILGVPQQSGSRVAYRLKQQGGHHRHIGQPQGVELMG